MTNIWRRHESVPLDVAAIFDPFGYAVHAALSFPVLGEDMLITGAGPIGIMAAAVAWQVRTLTGGNKLVTIILNDRAPRLH